ncbi:MAG: hypothetical protein ABI895_42135 [Deltaproteobacteria bacterium]
MTKISRSLRIVGLVLFIAGSAAARGPGTSHASNPTRYEPVRSTASSPQANSSRSSDGVTWTTQRLGRRSYWYASNGTTCLSEKLGQTVTIRCY